MKRTTSMGLCLIAGALFAAVACDDADEIYLGEDVPDAVGGSGGFVFDGGAVGGDAGRTGAGGRTGIPTDPFGGDVDEPGSGAAGAGGSAGGPGEVPVSTLNDGEILLVAAALNTGEIKEARAVLPRLQDPDAVAFAQRMVDDHQLARDVLRTLSEGEGISFDPNPIAGQVRKDAARHLNGLLSELPPTDLDQDYISGQVLMHEEALALLDELIDAADNEALVSVLTTMQGTVAEHLAQARSIDAALSLNF